MTFGLPPPPHMGLRWHWLDSWNMSSPPAHIYLVGVTPLCWGSARLSLHCCYQPHWLILVFSYLKIIFDQSLFLLSIQTVPLTHFGKDSLKILHIFSNSCYWLHFSAGLNFFHIFFKTTLFSQGSILVPPFMLLVDLKTTVRLSIFYTGTKMVKLQCKKLLYRAGHKTHGQSYNTIWTG